MKIFYIGTTSLNPADWDPWDPVGIAVANNFEELKAKYYVTKAVEIPIDSMHTPKILLQLDPPDWGEDT